MEQQFDNILIFRSDIQTEADTHRIGMMLDNHPWIERWCVDLDDDERILRVVSAKLKHTNIVDIVAGCGYSCEELKD